MGTVAPVGALVVTRPLGAGTQLHAGDLIVFRARVGRPTVYVHRIYKVLRGDLYMTKGDLNSAPDAWVISRTQIIGTPVAIIGAVGWLYKLAAWLCLGALVLVCLALALPRAGRRWVIALGPALLIALPLLRYQPLTSGFLYGYGQHGRRVVARVVDTGILPVNLTPTNGRAGSARPGQEVRVVSRPEPGHPTASIRVSAALPRWAWPLLALACLSPLAACELERRLGAEEGPAPAPAAVEQPPTLLAQPITASFAPRPLASGELPLPASGLGTPAPTVSIQTAADVALKASGASTDRPRTKAPTG